MIERKGKVGNTSGGGADETTPRRPELTPGRVVISIIIIVKFI